jgi:hypothetical protein
LVSQPTCTVTGTARPLDHTHTHTHTRTYMYVCMYVYIYIYIYIHTYEALIREDVLQLGRVDKFEPTACRVLTQQIWL